MQLPIGMHIIMLQLPLIRIYVDINQLQCALIKFHAIYKDMMAICDRILENSSKSHMKSSVFLHVFNDISTYAYVFTEYFLQFSVI